MAASNFKKSTADTFANYGSPARGRRTSNTATAEEVLKRLLKNHGLDVQIAKYQFVSHWEELVGKHISERAKPDCIKGKTLIIKVKSSAWAQELSFHKKVILARVNKFFTPDEMLKDIRFVIGAF